MILIYKSPNQILTTNCQKIIPNARFISIGYPVENHLTVKIPNLDRNISLKSSKYWVLICQLHHKFHRNEFNFLKFIFRPEPRNRKEREQEGCIEGLFDLNLVYEVTLNSSVEGNFSESVTKKFENCDEI